MKNDRPLPSRKEFHRNKEKQKKQSRSKGSEENELPSLTLIRVLALLFISMVAIFLLYSYIS
ncbi:hypothetical protein [Guptibacillus hwajinpoensis]|uniref:hypothetical protein n=1 Tax=Guptibacillus hwajinpoensis TaxID=208199 RepID=UPI001CFF15EF|nr:hypothetical protein [Pseudalkalibacillus hwajinpoensis]WLR60317.1 hypothetical protein LC071_02765 [Pseudalkalibacillus hwajinpoensis]